MLKVWMVKLNGLRDVCMYPATVLILFRIFTELELMPNNFIL